MTFQFVETHIVKDMTSLLYSYVFSSPERSYVHNIRAFSHFLCERSLLTSYDKQMLGLPFSFKLKGLFCLARVLGLALITHAKMALFKDEFPFGTGKQESMNLPFSGFPL